MTVEPDAIPVMVKLKKPNGKLMAGFPAVGRLDSDTATRLVSCPALVVKHTSPTEVDEGTQAEMTLEAVVLWTIDPSLYVAVT